MSSFVEFAKQKFEEYHVVPEYVEVAYDLWDEFKAYAKQNYVADFLGPVVTFSLTLPKGQAKLYFEDALETYKK
jgi:hypothetical protein